MKLSKIAVESILHVISTFDRERGVPHDYYQLEIVLSNTSFTVSPAGELQIAASVQGPVAQATGRFDAPLDDAIEAKQVLLDAARDWLD